MGKIHTHYDNLKVARMAPQEVIRAAYKALSQKYHPDKNPGDEKAARIMAILNSAYGTLADPQRRKEHDEWIAAEEWEIEWLESTRHEEPGHKHARAEAPAHAWADQPEEPRPVAPRRLRDWKWWGGLGLCLVGGWVGGILTASEPRLQSVLAKAWDAKAELAAGPHGGADTVAGAGQGEADRAALAPHADGKAEEPAADAWAVNKRFVQETGAAAAPVKVVSLSQIVLPGAGADCENETQSQVAPNGEPWPARSGYLEGFPVGNKGDEMQLTLDNANNALPVFIKIYDLERKSNVRYAFVQAHDTLLVDRLATGKYEIRYQTVALGADKNGCARRSKGDSRTAAE